MCQRKGLGCGTYLRNMNRARKVRFMLFGETEKKGNTDGGSSYTTMLQLFWAMKKGGFE